MELLGNTENVDGHMIWYSSDCYIRGEGVLSK